MLEQVCNLLRNVFICENVSFGIANPVQQRVNLKYQKIHDSVLIDLLHLPTSLHVSQKSGGLDFREADAHPTQNLNVTLSS